MEKAISLKVSKIIRVTNDAVSIHFKQPFFNKIKYMPGQYLTLLVNIGDQVVRRCYSLNSAPGVDSHVSVTVKRIKDGRVSNHLFNSIKEGDKLMVLKPMGNFTVVPDKKKKRHLVLFGAGSGITPLISIMKSILKGEPQSVVSLIYGNRDIESIIFNQELNEYKSANTSRLNLIHVLEDPTGLAECYKGRVERSQVGDLLAALPSFPRENTEYYICGPTGMMIEAEEGLKAFGVSQDSIFIERFSAPQVAVEERKVQNKYEDREVTIIYKSRNHKIDVKAGSTILDAALNSKLNLPYVCMDGICGTCKATCTSGEVFMPKGNVLSQKDIAAKKVLPCLCKPLTDNVVLEYN